MSNKKFMLRQIHDIAVLSGESSYTSMFLVHPTTDAPAYMYLICSASMLTSNPVLPCFFFWERGFLAPYSPPVVILLPSPSFGALVSLNCSSASCQRITLVSVFPMGKSFLFHLCKVSYSLTLSCLWSWHKLTFHHPNQWLALHNEQNFPKVSHISTINILNIFYTWYYFFRESGWVKRGSCFQWFFFPLCVCLW